MTLFVDPDKAKQFECSICLEIYKEPVQIGCEDHIFCKQCVDKLISQQRGSFNCPLCRKKCNRKAVTRVKFIDRQINSLKVQCCNSVENKKHINTGISMRRSARLKTKTESKIMKILETENNENINNSNKRCSRKRKRSVCFGEEIENCNNNNNNNKRRKLNRDKIFSNCKWIGSYSDLNSHIKICPLQKILCKYCNECIIRKELEKHYEKCELFPMHCILCGKFGITRMGMEFHIIEYCPMMEINCDKCKENIIRNKYNYHIENDCLETLIKCKFYEFGCKEKLKRKDEKNHIENAVITHNHLIQIANTVNDLKSEMLKNKLQNDKLKTELNTQTNKIKELYEKFNILENKQKESTNELNTIRVGVLANRQTQIENKQNELQTVTATINTTIAQLPRHYNNASIMYIRADGSIWSEGFDRQAYRVGHIGQFGLMNINK